MKRKFFKILSVVLVVFGIIGGIIAYSDTEDPDPKGQNNTTIINV